MLMKNKEDSVKNSQVEHIFYYFIIIFKLAESRHPPLFVGHTISPTCALVSQSHTYIYTYLHKSLRPSSTIFISPATVFPADAPHMEEGDLDIYDDQVDDPRRF